MSNLELIQGSCADQIVDVVMQLTNIISYKDLKRFFFILLFYIISKSTNELGCLIKLE